MSEYSVIPGAEPLFIAGNEVGCLISHGYTGSPQSMRYLGEQLSRKGGFTVSVPRLPGHGTSPQDMARRTAREWVVALHEALTELQQQCSTVFVIGLSMGGTLALHLAATRADVRGVVAINAPLFLDRPEFAEIAFAPDAPDFLPGIGADIKNPDADELSYEMSPVATAHQLYALMAATRELMPRLSCPLLALYSQEDHVVPPANGALLLESAASRDKRLVQLDNSYHVATVDNDRDRIVDEVLEFISSRRG